MADDALTIEVKMIVEDAQKKLAQVGQDITKLGQQALQTGSQHAQAAGQINQAGTAIQATGKAAADAGNAHQTAKGKVEEHVGALGRFGQAAGEAKNKLTELGSKVTEAASWGLPMSNLTYGLMGGGLAIIIAGLYSIVQKTVEWHSEVAQVSTILSNNTQVASQWVGIANEIGIQANTLTSAFRSRSNRCSRSMDSLLWRNSHETSARH